ncbi:MAG: gluconate 5-dehydrogenase [Planctomycetota bacterium]
MQQNPDQELDGRTAVITGGGRGIGLAIAASLADQGARVVMVARDRERLEKATAELCADGAHAQALVADIDDRGWLERLDEIAPQVDILVHNAAAFASYRPLEEVPPGEIEQVLATGIVAVIRANRHVLPGMKERNFGRLIHIGSVAARLGARNQTAYTTVKAALEGMMRSLAVEGARFGITSNLLELGLIETERTREGLHSGVFDQLEEAAPIGRAGRPEEVAHAASFLASPRSAFITGAVLPVSGGLGLGLPGVPHPDVEVTSAR